MFKVSVIVPVYNAEKYLEKAVNSAVELSEVYEVLLIDDASPDKSGELCDVLAQRFKKVKVLRHPNNENKGAGASRNLGLKTASCPYIAFLDADDYFLPNRFKVAKVIFENDLTVDGVYEAVGAVFYSENAKMKFAKWKGILPENLDSYLERVENRHLNSDDLLLSLLTSNTGRFCTDGIVFKKKLLEKTGMFNTSLRLHQDTDLWLRMAYCGKLISGAYEEPIAIRGVHEENRIHGVALSTRAQLYKSVYNWFLHKPVKPQVFRLIFKQYINHLYQWSNIKNSLLRKSLKLGLMVKEVCKNPVSAIRLIKQ
jgi:glycosyltransferase involved in cell wall biosynthesis